MKKKTRNNQEAIEYCKILTTSTRETFNSIKNVHCPILGVDIVFNARGFHHLLYDSDGTPRTVRERSYKLTLFPLAIPVVKNATAIVDEREIEIRTSRKKKAKKKKAKTYALVAKVGKKNPVDVRVIILRISDGNYMFWSIMRD